LKQGYEVTEEVDQNRRHFLGAGVMALAAAQLGMFGLAEARAAEAQPVPARKSKAARNGSLGPIKQINAGLLDVGYVEAGPVDGRPVILLHGWPYDIHSFVDVAPRLVSSGYRVIIPHLRGYGTTRFLSTDTIRNGQPSALAKDLVSLQDALGIRKAILAGFDWGARTAAIVAALWPERCKALVSVSGYLIGNQAAGKVPLPPRAELQLWYQFYLATERGRAGYEKYREDFAKLIWQLALPKWKFDDATFGRSADLWTILTTSASSSTTIAGGWGWLKASPNTRIWKRASRRRRSSRCPPSRSREMPMARRTPIQRPMPRSSRAGTRTVS